MTTLYPKDWQFRVGAAAGICVTLSVMFVAERLWIAALSSAAVTVAMVVLSAWLTTREG